MTQYTIGEIYRLQLLKTATGQPYKDKASVSNVLRGQPHTVKQTPHGPAKMYTKETIQKLNKRWK
ncbi:hypothetical protein [Caudoviricetes sp.]|nr:hypothetical protein [Caudoviricetes sp.]